MGNIIRLALIAGTGAGIAGVKRAGLRLAGLLAAAVVVGILLAGALGCFGIAGFIALTPQFGPVWSAALVGLCFALGAVILVLGCRYAWRRPRHASDPAGSVAGAPLAAIAALEGLGGLRSVVERNAIPVLLAAFAAGLIMNRRR